MPASGKLSLRLALFGIAAVLLVAPAQAGWPWNMPSTLRQQVGFGVGPGYHAPMVIVPGFRAPVAGQRVKYRWNAPQPTGCQSGFCGAMTTLDSSSSWSAPAAGYPAVTYPADAVIAPPVRPREPASPSDRSSMRLYPPPWQ